MAFYPNQYYPTQLNALPTYPSVSPTQPTQNGLTWVQGIEGAKSYLVAPNNTVTLWDSEAQVIYIKSADNSGLPSMKIIDYTIRENSPREPFRAPHGEFATKTDVESIKKDIEALKSRYLQLTEKAGEKDE